VATATSINGTTIPSTKTLVVTTDSLAVHAATTSAQLAGIISDETGSGALVFGTSPTLTTPTISGAATITVASGATVPLTIQNNGTGNSFVVNDEASDASPFVINAAGCVGIGAEPGAVGLLVKGSANHTGSVAFYKYTGTASSPTETLDWPEPILSLRGYGDFTTESMLSFGYSNDSNYQLADGVWAFKLDGIASATTSTSSTNLRLGGPGALVIGTAGTERMRIDSSGNTTINAIADATTTTAARGAGYMGVPQSSAATTGAYTIVAGDAGEHIYTTATRTVTIPANSSVAFPVGTAISFVAATGATVTIAITTDTLLLAGAGTTGSRTLAAFGMATAIKITSTSWIISGNGLT
jgi:hypothetical protein